MKSLGLTPYKKDDMAFYAALLESGFVSSPRSLRGTRKDSVSGFLWKRKFEFIMKHRYGISIKDVAWALAFVNNEVKGKISSKKYADVSLHNVFLNNYGLVQVQVGYSPKESVILSCKKLA